MNLTVTQNVTELNLTVEQESNIITIQPTIIVAATTSYMLRSVYDTNGNGIVDDTEKVNGLTVETSVPSGALFTDTVYDDTTIQAEVDLNTLKETNIAHPLVEKAVPSDAVFTDTIYDDTAIQSQADANTTAIGDIDTAIDTINGQII